MKKLFVPAAFALAALAAVVGSIGVADTGANTTAATPPEMKLPPGWTMEDMQACIIAGTPGKMQEHLAKGAGKWQGKCTMWMAPGADPQTSDCTAEATVIMDGRYVKCEMNGEMPGMGPYHSGGVYGFDNVSQQFVASFIDNHSTGIANGVGELSADGKTMTWKYTFNCPITKKPVVMREVETVTGPATKTLEMFGADPKSGTEFKMMSIQFTKQ